MNPVQGKHKASKFEPEDFISKMPHNVLHDVQFESGKFGEFFAQCPVFEILNMDYPRKMCYNTGLPKLKLSEAANLKILSLFLCNLDKTGLSGIFELMGFLPKLQELDLNFSNCKFTEGDDNMKFPTTFPCVKILKLSLDLSNGIMLSRAFQMTRSFLNLHTLEITTGERETLSTGTCSPDVDHNTMGPLQQLRRVVFTSFRALENEESLINDLVPEITSSGTIFELVASLPKLQELDLDFLCSKSYLYEFIPMLRKEKCRRVDQLFYLIKITVGNTGIFPDTAVYGPQMENHENVNSELLSSVGLNC
ncbi:hypothetical protein L1987_38918 [Smallanthus sonchifolius]|uniref:Uncharacterized protein n=1 Tax=Smallanthus sonchifolius TaxID=185202 RepID=A0ACB9HL94_9ASTR|nr:hypothetical protein L1987_38918 [Smallanthus sonchifolius]